jgi:hypothetical protein
MPARNRCQLRRVHQAAGFTLDILCAGAIIQPIRTFISRLEQMFIVLIKALVNDAASSRRISGASVSARNKALVKTALAMAGSILEMMFVDGWMLLCKKVVHGLNVEVCDW